MSDHDPARTVPRSPTPAPASDDTHPRVLDSHAPDPNRTTDHQADPAPTGTVARTPSDVVRLEEQAAGSGGASVPGYALLDKLGQGGMGVVYRARHLKLNRVVALKMMLGGEQANRSELIRFLAEAEAVAAIKHENVVQVFDYGEAEGRPYMALELCPGGTLARLLPKGAPATDPRAMAALVARVARGVAAAHALGIVHRDLKPGNVFLDESGVPKVADFGLAKRGEGADVTQAGVGMGTPAYMAPEQAVDAKFVGPAADVWALGVILYEALTGARPFTGTVQEIMAKAAAEEPPAPRRVAPAVPLDLELVCLKCLAKEPHERYPTAGELVADLDRFARGAAISVRPLGRAERAARWVRRNKVVTGAAAAVFLALSLGLGFSVAFGLEARDQARTAEARKRDADTAATEKESEARRANGEADRAKRNERAAVAARQTADKMLAKAILGPVTPNARAKAINAHEGEAFWQLTELRGGDVPALFLDNAVRTELAAQQLESRAEFVFQACVGLDAERRAATGRLFLDGLRREPRDGLSYALARAVMYWPDAPPELATEALRVLVHGPTWRVPGEWTGQVGPFVALARKVESQTAVDLMLVALPNKTHRGGFVRIVNEAAERMPPDAAARARSAACAALITHRDKQPTAEWRAELTDDLLTLAARLPPADAAPHLLAALRTENIIEPYLKLANALATAAGGMERKAAEPLCNAAVALYLKELATDPKYTTQLAMARLIANTVPHMDPAAAAAACAAANRVLLRDPARASTLMDGIVALVPVTPPAEATDTLLNVLKRFPMSQEVVSALLTVTDRLPPAGAAAARAAALDALTAALRTEKYPLLRQAVAKQIVRVVGRSEPAAAFAFVRGLYDGEPDLLRRGDLVNSLLAVLPGADPRTARAFYPDLASTIFAAIGRSTGNEPHELALALPNQLVAVARHLEPGPAADVLLAALGKYRGPDPSKGLGRGPERAKVVALGLAEVAGRLDPADARLTCAAGAEVLRGALEGETNWFPREALYVGYVALVVGLDPAEARDRVFALALKEQTGALRELVRGLERIAPALPGAQTADTYLTILSVAPTYEDVRRALLSGLSEALARCEPAEADRLYDEAVEILGRRLPSGNDRRGYGKEVAALFEHRPAEAAVARLRAAAAREPNYYARGDLIRALARAADGVPPQRAADALLPLFAPETNHALRVDIAKGLAAAAARTKPADAARLCAAPIKTLLTELINAPLRSPTDISGNLQTELMGEAFTALVAHAGPEAVADVMAAIKAQRDGRARWELIKGLVVIVERGDPRTAADALHTVMYGETAIGLHRTLADGLTVVARRLPPPEAARLRYEAAIHTLALLTRPEDESTRKYMLRGLIGLTTGVLFDEGQSPQLGAASAAGMFANPALRFPALVALHPARQQAPPPNPLPVADLVELLKNPFCVGDARRAVLDALELSCQRRFADQWAFVEYARRHRPELDLVTPPQRTDEAWQGVRLKEKG